MEKEPGFEGNGFDPKGPGEDSWDEPNGRVFEEKGFISVPGGNSEVNVALDEKSGELV